MYYNELYDILKGKFDSKTRNSTFEELNLTINTISMHSERADLLDGSPLSFCDKHQFDFMHEQRSEQVSFGLDDVEAKDYDIACNKSFDYYILKRADIEKASGAIIFFSWSQ